MYKNGVYYLVKEDLLVEHIDGEAFTKTKRIETDWIDQDTGLVFIKNVSFNFAIHLGAAVYIGEI